MRLFINKDQLDSQVLKAMVHYSGIALQVENTKTWWDTFNLFSKKNMFCLKCGWKYDRLSSMHEQLRVHVYENIRITEEEFELVYSLKSKDVLWKEMFG